MFPIWKSSPKSDQIRERAKKELNRRFGFYKPFVIGMAMVSEDTLRTATPFELILWDEVSTLRETFLDSKVINAQLVERKK